MFQVLAYSYAVHTGVRNRNGAQTLSLRSELVPSQLIQCVSESLLIVLLILMVTAMILLSRPRHRLQLAVPTTLIHFVSLLGPAINPP